MYKISIIIPVFNCENTLEDAFNSILNQSFGFENIEILFIDDCSTDNSVKIIKRLANSYDNVKFISLDENSGFPGKPRNIGIKNASSEYIMFLDADDTYLENACSFLYNEIIENNLDIVSGNYNIIELNKKIKNIWWHLNLNNKTEIQIDVIEDEPTLFSCPPSIWAKIYRKDFILNNELYFITDLPAEDLIWISKCFLKAKGIKFIDIPLVNYNMRYTGNNKSISTIKTKKIMYNYLKVYKELFYLFVDTEFIKYAVHHLFFWSKQLILSDLPTQDKIELLRFATPLYDTFRNTNIKTKYPFKPFFKKIYAKDYLGAIALSDELSFYFSNDKYHDLISDIKNKDIIILFWGLESEIGGLFKTICNRANLFDDNGYSVTLLSIDCLKDYEFIINNYTRQNYLNKSIKIINIFDYYLRKNTSSNINQLNTKLKLNFSDKPQDGLVVKTTRNADNSNTLKYYNCNNSKECNEKNMVKEELYIKGHLVVLKSFENGTKIFEEYYTFDGFNYLVIDYKTKNIILFDRESDCYISFNNINEFRDYFVTEICLKSSEKPFLINDSSSHKPSIKNIKSDIAYKIGVVHSNPYTDKNHCYGSNMRIISPLKETKFLDAIVILTEKAKADFEKEVKYDNFVVIPNFIYENPINTPLKKEENVISIFARLSPEKNLKDIIKALKIVIDIYPNIILKIYGRALLPYEINEKKSLISLVNSLNINDSIKFMGHVENAYEEMQKSILTVLVSDIEGLPMVLIESMFNYTPVISYDINYGPRDVITHGVDGFIVNQYDINSLAEHIITLVENPKKAYEMGIKANQKIKDKFSPEVVLNKWELLFKDIYEEDLLNNLKYKKYDFFNK